MGEAILAVLVYFGKGLFLTLKQLVILLGPALVLAFAMHHLSNSVRNRASTIFGDRLYVFLTAPGIMIHELGHIFFCIVFRHKIEDFSLFSPDADGTLGYVNHSYDPTNIYQVIGNFFIGTGPIWFGVAVIYFLSRFLLSSDLFEPIRVISLSYQDFVSWSGFIATLKTMLVSVWQVFLGFFNPVLFGNWSYYLFIYLVFCVGSHVTLSGPDIEGAVEGFVVLFIVLGFFNLLTMWLGDFLIKFCLYLTRYYVAFFAAMFFVIILNILVSTVVLLFSSFGKFTVERVREKL